MKRADEFTSKPTYELAMQLDKDISILRFIIGEDNFLALHYFRRLHEQAIKIIDNKDKTIDKGN